MKRAIGAVVVVLAAIVLTGCGPDKVHYNSCDDARKAGAAPLHSGDPGYSRDLDRDGDGTACE